ncbi:MAG: glucoamylase family protein [Anaerolineales bacterium]|nr:glucoamylase family protein [Anaerolineales bacterium]
MKNKGLLLSYFENFQDARAALERLWKRGYRRSVLISKPGDEKFELLSLYRRAWLLHALLFSFAAAALGGLVSMWPGRLSFLPSSGFETLLFVTVGVLTGFLIGYLFSRMRMPPVPTELIEIYGGRMIAEENLVLLFGDLSNMEAASKILRQVAETEPSIFVLHPERDFEVIDEPREYTSLAIIQLRARAGRLARRQRVDLAGGSDPHLLKRIDQIRKTIHVVCADLNDALRLEQSLGATAEWILDNEYLIEGHVQDVLDNLPQRYFSELPALASEPDRGLPRIYSLARNLTELTDARLDQDNIIQFIEGYQESQVLTIGELWALPLFLRIALVERIGDLARQAWTEMYEREQASYWAYRLLSTLRREPDQLFAIINELTRAVPSPSHYFGVQLTGHLYDEDSLLTLVQNWLERTVRHPLAEQSLREQSRQAADQLSIGNAITSLRTLSLLDWRELFEALSHVERALRRDPAGIYQHMDFDTRNQYREAVEVLARGSGSEEVYVARLAVEMAEASGDRTSADPRRAHVGTYLIRDGRNDLEQRLHARVKVSARIRAWIKRWHTPVYLLLIALLTLVLMAPAFVAFDYGAWDWPFFAAVLFLLGPASQVAVEIANYLLTRILPACWLPKMDFEETGIPDAFRTLVIIPTLLTDEETIRQEVEKLEIRFLANQEANLAFGLFSDYADSPTPQAEDDGLLLQTATAEIERLNQKHGHTPFFLLHREREWVETEQQFIGWERKRGKLEELNRLICRAAPTDQREIVRVGDPDALQEFRFVITLDSDTQLPRDTARRMIETLAHPLNQPVLTDDDRVVEGTYGIIQPRVSPSLPSASATPFSRLFTNPVGTDPYTKAVSNVYQDLTGETSYLGKGIYDPRVFDRALGGVFPEQRLLSHDLIEGAYVRVGLASDIELFDEFPATYAAYGRREHRWIRGDWQILDWLFPTVPSADGTRVRNPLSLINRWKIFDNLRRSLVPATSVAALLTAWLVSQTLSIHAMILIAMMLLFQPLSQPLTWLTSVSGHRTFSPTLIRRDIQRALAEVALLPHKAGLSIDAIIRVWYRRLISKRRLLEWTTSQMGEWHSRGHRRIYVFQMGLISLFSLFLFAVLNVFQVAQLAFALPWLGLWSITPVIGWMLNRTPESRPRTAALRSSEVRMLRRVARRTWRYFADLVGPDSHWLPPDNYQVSHQNQLAMRTSPTNIGLWMLSALGASDLGYMSIDQMATALVKTLDTLERLERFEGHLLNWYSLEDLSPLEPRYVSTVDSGNFIASIWTLIQGLHEVLNTPVVDDRARLGLLDSTEILVEALNAEGLYLEVKEKIEPILRALREEESDPAELIERLRQLHAPIKDLASTLRAHAGMNAGAAYWARMLERELVDWFSTIDRYLSWLDHEPEKMEAADLRPAVKIYGTREGLNTLPSISELADLFTGVPLPIESDQLIDPEISGSFDERLWHSARAAQETRAQIRTLIENLNAFSGQINLGFLYDPKRRLFTVGYNVSRGTRDSSYYDLIASEVRLGAFVAIARNDVSVDHWLALGRPYTAHEGHRVLLSWTGTMFEYLMPVLFQRVYPNSLWDQAVNEAVELQILYGRRRGVPWGISESAFADLDIHRTYQYKAFGVPWLGLKRGLESDLVVAPYATMLALQVKTKQAIRNLERLAARELLQDYGYYESIDFSRRPAKGSEPGVIVRAYMAHHQGMSMLAMVNVLCDDPFQRRFHADRRVKAVEPLLYERVPAIPAVHHISTRDQAPARLDELGERPSVSKFDTAHTDHPKIQLLSNGRYKLLFTNAGGGYSRWEDYDLTRWRSDPTLDSWGNFCYIHDLDTGRVWSNTYHPVGGEIEEYEARFPLDRAEIRRAENGVVTETEVIVSPEDDVEIRRITLVNRSLRPRRIGLTSYIELALAPHGSDVQHPAFNKLFIKTEAVESAEALIAHRRLRSPDEEPIYSAHRITIADGLHPPLRFETDRRAFIGRGRSLRDPLGAVHVPGDSDGFVLDPIFSIRRDIRLAPGERVQVSLVLAAGRSREAVLGLMEKYGDPSAIQRAFELAWASAQLELRMQRIQADQARRFQHLASYLIYPHYRMRPSAERVLQNRKGQSGLWPYAISGDLPIALVSIEDEQGLGLVRQMLQAQTYWRKHGLMVDLVILNEESSSYEQPLNEKLEQLIQAHSLYTGPDQPGGVYLKIADQMPDDDLTLLQSVARVSLVAARGPLSQQLGAPYDITEPPEEIEIQDQPDEASRQLPYMELPYFNGLGGFNEDGKEYIVYLGPDTHTPAPWVNVIANPSFGTMVSESGSGFTWYGNSQRNRLTAWSNDPVLDPTSEGFYIRDEETGRVWSPTPNPIRERTAYRIRHGAGYTIFEHNSHAIEQVLTIYVPQDDRGGEPVKVSQLSLKNNSNRLRRLSVTYYVEWTLGERREESQQHVTTQWDEEARAILAQNGYHPDYGDRVAFAAISPRASSFTGDRKTFLGRNQSVQNPDAMRRKGLSGRVGALLDPCAGVQTVIELQPEEEIVLVGLLGQAGSRPEARALVQKYRDPVVVDQQLEAAKLWWDRTLGVLDVETPELSINFMLNRWLLYQSLSCRIWGRSAFYQSGGAFGFRDQLQDVLSLIFTKPEFAREHILRSAGRQFEAGDVQHWWHPPGGAGVRTRISDDLLWLPYATAEYVRATGDQSILRESIRYLEGRQLEEGEHEAFIEPSPSAQAGLLFDHCKRAVERGSTRGPDGLPLIGTGDWNDGMNRVGENGRGESVWLAWFLVVVLDGMAFLAREIGDEILAERYADDAASLRITIDREAWDGAWYRRARFDDGTPLGSAANDEARIDSLPQSWAWIAGGGDPERAQTGLESAWRQLVLRDERLVLLFTPPFDLMRPSPGYIQGYPPGVRENGGQYTHAAIWLAIALARSGDGNRAAELMRILNPVERARDISDVWRYKLEPYAVPADVYNLTGHIGEGGWSWYTGSSGWMYRAWVEEILGLRRRASVLEIDPVIPSRWSGFKVNYKFGEAIYEITVENPEQVQKGVQEVELDGRPLENNLIPLEDQPVRHSVRVRMGAPAKDL